ncbi:type I restriction endonuclease subunit R, EcoR124 family [Empedobacter falsenii]|uniref:type I restriction endonuclease subunit R, EcoR124 family n=1 Tax=Empedobacter falsenii TaxID=343874 RepID=UPI0035283059
MFAVSSIEAAKLYYNEFKKQQKDLPELQKLKVATIFSFGQNDPEEDGMEEENSDSTEGLNASDRDFLDTAILDYNIDFKTTYDTSPEKFQNYYKDVSLRMKNREIDILIVVNMFLTGFDATTLNTLWVDKNLRMHGLLQAYSRTNRILNSVKKFGNIVCFRNLEDATNKCLALFGNKEAAGIVLLKTFDEYYNGYVDTEKDKEYPGYSTLANELLETFPIGKPIISEEAKKDFIRLYGAILKLDNILKSFDDYESNKILTDRDLQDYHSVYINLYQEFRNTDNSEKEIVNDDLEFEMELIKQVEINIDYILLLIRKYFDSHLKDKEIVVSIKKAVDSSIDLINKKDLIEKFIESLTPTSDVDEDWKEFIQQQKQQELENIIKEENLKAEETKSFVNNSFQNGEVIAVGKDFSNILPPISRFSPDGNRTKKKETVLGKILNFFDRFYTISN